MRVINYVRLHVLDAICNQLCLAVNIWGCHVTWSLGGHMTWCIGHLQLRHGGVRTCVRGREGGDVISRF
jgi:hypothetical protein